MQTLTYLGRQAWKGHKSYFIANGIKAVLDALTPFVLIWASPMLVDELDFQLTESKEALDQANAAKAGIGWRSGGVGGIYGNLFVLCIEIVRLAGTAALIVLKAPALLVIIAVLESGKALLTRKRNAMEIEYHTKNSMINRIIDYLGWSLSNFRYGKDIRLYDAHEMMVQKWEGFADKLIGNERERAAKNSRIEGASDVLQALIDTGIYLYMGVLVVLG